MYFVDNNNDNNNKKYVYTDMGLFELLRKFNQNNAYDKKNHFNSVCYENHRMKIKQFCCSFEYLTKTSPHNLTRLEEFLLLRFFFMEKEKEKKKIWEFACLQSQCTANDGLNVMKSLYFMLLFTKQVTIEVHGNFHIFAPYWENMRWQNTFKQTSNNYTTKHQKKLPQK